MSPIDRAHQRLEALTKADTIRLGGVEVRREIAALSSSDGAMRVADLLENRDWRIQSMPAGRLLRSIQRLGPVKVEQLMWTIGVTSQDRRVGRLTDRQITVLVDSLRTWDLWPHSRRYRFAGVAG